LIAVDFVVITMNLLIVVVVIVVVNSNDELPSSVGADPNRCIERFRGG